MKRRGTIDDPIKTIWLQYFAWRPGLTGPASGGPTPSEAEQVKPISGPGLIGLLATSSPSEQIEQRQAAMKREGALTR